MTRAELNGASLPDPAGPKEAVLGEDSSFTRLWLGFGTARVSIALVLLGLLATLYTLAPAPTTSRWLVGMCTAYFLAALAVRIYARPRAPGKTFDAQWVSTIGVDLLAFSTLQFLQAGGINYSPLYALPVLMASVLGSTLLALGTAAAVTLLLLADAWIFSLHLLTDTAARFFQAGLTGIGYFALAILVNQLSAWLAREELAARQSQKAARMQAQVNELVIETLADGVLVVDPLRRVHAANPAARSLLGVESASSPTGFDLAQRPDWEPLGELALSTLAQRTPQQAELTIAGRRLHVRTRLTVSNEHQAESLCVMFLQDLREIEARLRTEKLAAMGRMSAAVAHEIRNPLAAISQANALMEEDLHEPALQQLSSLVRKNTQRLARIVDEILEISRVHHQGLSAPPLLDLDAAVAAVCEDWAAQTGASHRLRLVAGAPDLQVPFDTDHLRRVLVNLLDNALRYAGEGSDSILVFSSIEAKHCVLHVWSDSAPLDPVVQRHLFEPFFSSESRSSGLGLYICRELCERHAATLNYYRRIASVASAPREGNEFAVRFAATDRSLASPASFDKIAA